MYNKEEGKGLVFYAESMWENFFKSFTKRGWSDDIYALK